MDRTKVGWLTLKLQIYWLFSESEEYAAIEIEPFSSRLNKNPYQPVGDFLSNISRFKIIESTLREGEQFANAFFETETKIKIAKYAR